ncbi:MAG: D-tyrosyl-tRNA(Tyr) deacylase [Deltaproteobacteria bacterium]|jgi:D-aminoacyl-tRNA deacylase|nr:D-tyrosyl-tRNA(Tyr) deacylase [Deltaproteobacteria bacterium]MBT4525052.1 D-tyrosyl-tRNA(Tyr) deacylase [Deltaproteobacteria bacterium]
MKIILQRVKKADVMINHRITGRIKTGYLILVGFERGDREIFIKPMLDKILKLKLFTDSNGKMNFSVSDVKGGLLIISQFTLSADLKKGKKPSFSKALPPKLAKTYYELFLKEAQSSGILVQSGEFGAMMQVTLQNDGPVTLILNSSELFPALYQEK